jgi:hypothetical protein
MTLKEWRSCAFEFLAKPKEPFREFVELELKNTHDEPPAHPDPPKAPEANATQAEKDAFKEKHNRYLETINAIDRQAREWNSHLSARLNSWLWQTKFLFKADKKIKADSRDFTVVLLGIDAWLALAPDGRREELKKKCEGIALNECVDATLSLQWKWPNNEILPPVTRFEIQPGRKSR